MKILILNWRCPKNPKGGGAEIVTMQHARGWVKHGHDVTWITSRYKKDITMDDDNLPAGKAGLNDGTINEETIDGVVIKRIGVLGMLHVKVALFLLSHGNSYDIIVDEIHGIPFFAPLFTRTPVVAFIHEVADEIWDYMYPFPINKMGKLLESLYFTVYKKCTFWTDAPSTIDELVERGIRRDHCVAIPCPITRTASTENRKLKIDTVVKKDPHPTFLFVSRVVRMKGVEEVIKTFAFIQKELPHANLWIVGGGETRYVSVLRKMVVEYGISNNVTFFGSVNENKKYELMARAHILLHASVKEGWGLVVLEAASVGTPAVVYNVPGLRDVVHTGKTGIVIAKNSPNVLAKAATQLILDKIRYKLYQKTGKERADNLSWDDAIKNSEGVLLRTTII